jgi:hypothetical protein
MKIVKIISTLVLLWWSICPYAYALVFFSWLIPVSHSRDYIWASFLLQEFLAAASTGPIIGGLIALFYGRAYLPISILFTVPTVFVLVYIESSSSQNAMKSVVLGYQVFSYAALLIGAAVIARRSRSAFWHATLLFKRGGKLL